MTVVDPGTRALGEVDMDSIGFGIDDLNKTLEMWKQLGGPGPDGISQGEFDNHLFRQVCDLAEWLQQAHEHLTDAPTRKAA